MVIKRIFESELMREELKSTGQLSRAVRNHLVERYKEYNGKLLCFKRGSGVTWDNDICGFVLEKWCRKLTFKEKIERIFNKNNFIH